MVKTGPFSDSLRVRLSTKLPLTGESGAHSVLGADNLTCLLGRSCKESDGNQWFPIPMRGNELIVTDNVLREPSCSQSP